MAKAKKKKRGPNKAVRVRRLLKKCHEAWSLAIRLRDGKCVRCGATDKQLSAHHWIVSKARSLQFRFDTRNGVALDYGCHIRVVHNEASLAAVMGIFNNQTAVTWDMAMAIIERAKRDTRETSAPYTEDELLGILEGLNGEIAKYSRKGGRDIHHEHEDLQRIPVQESGNHDHPAAAPAAAGPGGEPHHVREEDPGGGDR